MHSSQTNCRWCSAIGMGSSVLSPISMWFVVGVSRFECVTCVSHFYGMVQLPKCRLNKFRCFHERMHLLFTHNNYTQCSVQSGWCTLFPYIFCNFSLFSSLCQTTAANPGSVTWASMVCKASRSDCVVVDLPAMQRHLLANKSRKLFRKSRLT